MDMFEMLKWKKLIRNKKIASFHVFAVTPALLHPLLQCMIEGKMADAT